MGTNSRDRCTKRWWTGGHKQGSQVYKVNPDIQTGVQTRLVLYLSGAESVNRKKYRGINSDKEMRT